MYLERILGTSTKVNVLNVLVNNPNKRFVEKDLAAATGNAVSEVNRQMPELVNSGIVHLERIGKAKVYSINVHHFLYNELLPLFVDLNKVFLRAAKEISKYAASEGARTVLLFGSVAAKQVRSDLSKAPSDIDLVFLVDSENKKIHLYEKLIAFIGGRISIKYGLLCYPIVLTLEEYLNALENAEQFIIRVHAEGVELYGRKPRRFS